MNSPLGRAAGPLLATVCGVCTGTDALFHAGHVVLTLMALPAYAALGPELQKQQAERDFKDQHSATTPDSPDSPDLPTPPSTGPQASSALNKATADVDAVSNDNSVGDDVRQALRQAKAEASAAQPGTGWFGLGAFGKAFGGAESDADKHKHNKDTR